MILRLAHAKLDTIDQVGLKKDLSAAYHIMSSKETCAKLLRPLGKSYLHLLSRIKKVADLKALGSWKYLSKLKLSLHNRSF